MLIRSAIWKRKRLLAVFVSLWGITGLLYLLLVWRSDDPPVEQVTAARNALGEAKRLNAHVYAPDEYGEAEKHYLLAIICWQKENEKFFFNRDFITVRKQAILSEELAKDAGKKASGRSSELTATLRVRLEHLKKEVNRFQDTFDKLPVPKEIRENNSKGNLYLTEATLAYDAGQYLRSEEKLKRSKELLNDSYATAKKLLRDYFRSYETWQEWAEKTVKGSKQGKETVLLIDKFARQCFIYKGGKLVKTFEVELGKNWIGDKHLQGDKATPEGFYQVTRKMENGHTIYYKALLLNYPNKEDQVRFDNKKRKGLLPDKARIGGSIEIHGSGGKGADWTDGCIALKNEDMDELFKYCSKGTRVTIVGSLKPLNQVTAI